MKKISILILLFIIILSAYAENKALPGKYSVTWAGNTFSGKDKWVQNFIIGFAVGSKIRGARLNNLKTDVGGIEKDQIDGQFSQACLWPENLFLDDIGVFEQKIHGPVIR